MIQRRQFLGSLATVCVASGATPQIANAFSQVTPDLNWVSETIQTIPHNGNELPPVVTGVSLQKTGDLLAIVGDDHFVSLYDVRKRQFVQDLDRHTDWIRATEFSPSGSRLATAGNDRKICVWDANDWTQPLWMKKHPHAVIDIAYSNDGTRLATVGFDAWLRIFDASTGEQITKLACHCPDNHAVAYSRDNRLIAAGGRSGTIRVWDTASTKVQQDVSAHRKRIRSLEFTSDGQILSAGDDQIVQVSNPLGVGDSKSLPRHAAKLYASALLDGNLIATAGSDNLVHIWQMSDMRKIGSLRGHTGTVTSLDYSGHHLVSGSYDTHVRVWSTEQHTASTHQRHTGLSNGWNQKLK